MTKAKTTSKGRRGHPLILTVMRVKNEEAYLRYALESLRPLGGPVILLDDGSTDTTPEIAKSFEFVEYIRQDEATMDEGRDRTRLYRAALDWAPEWIFTLDGDEVLDPTTPARMLRAIKKCPEHVNVFQMCIAIMASAPDAKKQKWYGPEEPVGAFVSRRLFRVSDAVEDSVIASDCPGNLHCGNIPEMRNRFSLNLNAWIKSYGYESSEACARKLAFYEEHKFSRNVARMIALRAKTSPVVWADGASAPEMGKQNTVSY